MGEQIHIGGFQSSMDLAQRAGIAAGWQGVDLCCCTGAGMRFLVRFLKVARMTGVDATPADAATGPPPLRRRRPGGQNFVRRSATPALPACRPASSISSGAKTRGATSRTRPKLIAEAARLIKPKGKIAFTDWMEGPAGLTEAEAARYLGFMKFPNVLTLGEYQSLLEANGCAVRVAQDTGRFAARHAALSRHDRKTTDLRCA